MKIPNLNNKTLNEQLFDKSSFKRELMRFVNSSTKKDFSGFAPSLFVGKFGYPNVRMGVLSTSNYTPQDNPLHWSKNDVQIPDIFRSRSSLINAGNIAHVKLPTSRIAAKLKELGQEVAMAARPIELEVNLDKKPLLGMKFPSENLPHGPTATLTQAKLTGNPKIPKIVDKVVSDTDLKSVQGINKLWNRGIDEHYLSQLLSAGTVGQRLERRLVPTRWSITATDDIVAKQLMNRIQDFSEIDFSAFFGGYLGNYYLILTLPQPWSFELFEMYAGSGKKGVGLKKVYTDYESFRGRKIYASETAGGYYAAKLAVLEYLSNVRRKAGVLVFRFITDEYWAPLGVWVIREATRRALSTKPFIFSDQDRLITFAQNFTLKKFGIEIAKLTSSSRLLAERKQQTRLSSYFNH